MEEKMGVLAIVAVIILKSIFFTINVILDEFVGDIVKDIRNKRQRGKRIGKKLMIFFIICVIEYINNNVVEIEATKVIDETIENKLKTDDRIEDIIIKCGGEEISVEELNELSDEGRFYIRNGIYAHHGRIFKEEYLTEYYKKYDWYTPSIEPENFDANVFTQSEWKTIKNILSIEAGVKFYSD